MRERRLSKKLMPRPGAACLRFSPLAVAVLLLLQKLLLTLLDLERSNMQLKSTEFIRNIQNSSCCDDLARNMCLYARQ